MAIRKRRAFRFPTVVLKLPTVGWSFGKGPFRRAWGGRVMEAEAKVKDGSTWFV